MNNRKHKIIHGFRRIFTVQNAALLSALAAGAVMLCFMTALHGEEVRIQQEIAARVVRFHVKANSDTKEDQENKLAVRDALLDEMDGILGKQKNQNTVCLTLREHLKQLETCAREVLDERGCSQEVKVTLGQSWFPQKTYGEYTFPSGEYEALKVTIGSGGGHNWWCMLYPSLCFPDALHPVPEEQSASELEGILSDEAYDTILRHGRLRFSFFLAFFAHSG